MKRSLSHPLVRWPLLAGLALFLVVARATLEGMYELRTADQALAKNDLSSAILVFLVGA